MKSSELVLLLQVLLTGFVSAAQSKRICPEKCGNVSIPYPFGTEKGCYLDKSYHIKCNQTTQIPYLNISAVSDMFESQTDQLQVLEINIEGRLRVALPIAYACFDEHGTESYSLAIALTSTRFPFSSTRNMFTGVGCGIDARIGLPPVDMHCTSDCDPEHVKNRSCLGHGCCRAPIPEGMRFGQFMVHASDNRTGVWNNSKCGYAFVVEKGMYNFHVSHLSTLRSDISFPVVLDWSVGNTACEEAQKDNKAHMCQENTECHNGKGGLLGYRCKCSHGFTGNPYITDGCQDVNECESAELNDCLPGCCENTYGSYNCICPKGHQDIISEGIAIFAALAMIFVYLVAKKRKYCIKGRKDFFKQNGGIMLENALFACKDPVNRAKIFTEEELRKATGNFNKTNLIGQGGCGFVYKGILGNKTQVAIKKSKVIAQSQIKQFVNEVILLSQINHPNIVKLLGCCLETQVPLLVYEYITNNTLCHHIRTNTTLTFRKRLKIAAETAKALAYMHSTTKIIHRDVKPSNLLLLNDFTVKVSDFGISKCIPIGQTHLSTLVKGTKGYVDPEYYDTSKLTEKSDVYSFGVVLIELLTGKNIHSLEESTKHYRGVAAYLAALLESNTLIQVLDNQLKRDEYNEVVESVAQLAVNCLDLEGMARPTMKEVEQELGRLRCVLLAIEAETEII